MSGVGLISSYIGAVLAGEMRGRRQPYIGRRAEWRYRLLRLLKPDHLYLDGFELIGWHATVPRQISALLARGDYEAPERRALTGLLRPGDRVLEIGSCIGVLSLTAARIVGAENVVVYEPNRAAATAARRNFAANALPIRLVERAVDSANGIATLSIGRDSWLGASLYHDLDENEAVVEVEGIAGIIAREQPTALILDAEGAEAAILSSCPLDGLRLIILELHPDLIGDSGVDYIHGLISGVGFDRIDRYCEFQTEAWRRS